MALGLGLGLGLSRRTGAEGFLPTDIDDLEAWYNPKLETVAATTILVSDRSGGTIRNATSSGADSPEIAANGIGSNNTMRFDGSTFLEADALAAFMSGDDQTCSIHIPFKLTTLPTASDIDIIWGFGRSSSNNPTFWFGADANTGNFIVVKRDDGGSDVQTQITTMDTESHFISIIRGGNSVTVWLDGVRVLDNSASALGVTTLDQFTIGAFRRISESNNMIGDVGELLFYSRVNTTAEIQQIGRYLSKGWYSSRPLTFDYFLIAGQSNAEGRGTSGSSPAVTLGNGFEHLNGTDTFKPLADPVGGATDGSAWPSFTNQWVTETGRGCCFVEGAAGGTGLDVTADTGNGYWSDRTGGEPYNLAVVAMNEMMINAADGTIFAEGRRIILWCQGENDGDASVAEATYESDMQDLIDDFGTSLTGGYDNLFIFALGERNNATLVTEYAAIRKAQSDVADVNANTFVVFWNALNFPPAKENLMQDLYHYNQDGYNQMGTYGAKLGAVHLGLRAFDSEDLPNLRLEQDASDASTITSSGGRVSQWDDKSSNADHATQATELDKPTTGIRTIGGLNAIDFDGTDQFMNFPSGIPTDSAASSYLVYDPDDTDTSAQVYANSGTGGGSNRFFFSNQACDFGQTLLARVTPATGVSLVEFQGVDWGTSTTEYLKVGTDAIQSTSVTRSGTTNSAFDVGARLGANNFDGGLGQMLYYVGQHPDGLKNFVGTTLSSTWTASWSNI